MALIQGKAVQEGPKQLPANPKLWNMYVAQAKSKFRVYPSPAAAHWVRSHYSQVGGKFVDSAKDIDPRFRDYVQESIDKKLAAQKEKVTKKVGISNLRGERYRG
jgi:hypothetical protein